MTAIHAAAQGGHTNTLIALLAKSKKLFPELADKDGATPVHFAAARGRRKTLWWMLNHGGATGNERDSIEATPVHDAAEQGQLLALQILAHCGAELSVTDSDGLTPRKLALDGGHSDCAQFLATATTRKATGRQAHELSAEEIAELEAVEDPSISYSRNS